MRTSRTLISKLQGQLSNDHIREVLEHNGMLIRYIPKAMLGDREVVRSAVEGNGHAFRYAEDHLKGDVEYIRELLAISGKVYHHISKDIREAHPELLDLALKKELGAIASATAEARRDERILWRIAESYQWQYLKYMDPGLLDDIGIVKKLTQEYYGIYRYASERVRRDPELAKFCIRMAPSMMKYAPDELTHDLEFVLGCVVVGPGCYQYLPEEMRRHETIALAALRSSGLMLEYAPAEIQDNDRIVMAALRDSSLAYCYASERFRNREELFREAYAMSPELACGNMGEELKDRMDIAMKIMKDNANLYRYLSEELRDSIQLARLAMDASSNNMEFLSNRLKNSMDFVADYILSDVKHGGFNKAYENAGIMVRADRKITLRCVKVRGMLLKYASLSLRDDREVVLTALAQNRNAYRFASKRLREEPELKQLAGII